MDIATQRRIAQAGKDVDPGWYRIHRRLSIHLTRLALALGMKADHASYAMMLAGLAGAALLVPAHPLVNVLGFAVLYLAFLLDKVDGELARLQGTQNARGIFLDRMHHRLVEPCLFLLGQNVNAPDVAVHVFRVEDGRVGRQMSMHDETVRLVVDDPAGSEPQYLAPDLHERQRLAFSESPPLALSRQNAHLLRVRAGACEEAIESQ